MEIKATLNKPYTEPQKVDFIVEQNYTKGYEIKETESALEAWGYTAEEIAEREKQQHKQELISQLNALDLKCIRALRAIQAGQGTETDTQVLAELEEQAEDLRLQLKDLQGE